MKRRRETTVEPLAVQVFQAAQMLGVSERSIRRLCHNQKLEFTRIGNRILIRLDEVERLVREGGATR